MKNILHYLQSSHLRNHLTAALVAVFISGGLTAQVANYSFTQSNGTYTPISGGTVLGTTTSDDQRFLDPAVPEGTTLTYTGPGFDIGFAFYFNGIAFDRIGINNNGWIAFGQSAISPSVDLNTYSSFEPLSSTAINNPDYLRNRVAAFGRDIQAQEGAELRIETIGSSPNQICVIQWTNYKRYGTSGTGDTINFQIRLNEAGGDESDQSIDIVYGKVGWGSSATLSYRAQIGLAGTLNADFNDRITYSPYDWNATQNGVVNSDGCQLPYTGVDVVAPASGLTITYTPPSPCTGTPSPGNTITSDDFLCPGSLFNLSLQNSNLGSMITYQWQSSADGNSWNDIPGATQAAVTYAQVSDSYYRCAVTCTNSNQTGNSNPVFVGVAGSPGLPYSEDFESIGGNNEYPNCMSSTNLNTYTFTYTVDQGSYNRYANNGTKFASFKYGCNDYFFTPALELTAGSTYQFSFYYITDGYAGWNTLEAHYGSMPDAASMTGFISAVTTPINTTYQQITGIFTPATTGTYFIGIYCSATYQPWYLSIDDLNLVAFPPCTGTPEAGNTVSSGVAVCSGVSFTLSLTGTSIASGLSYQWQKSIDGSNWSDISGATTPNCITNQTEDMYYRCRVTCDNSGLSDHSTSLQVTTYGNFTPPYNEDFESIVMDNDYPGCMSSTNLGTHTFTYTAAQGSYNQTAHGGTKFASFAAPGTDYFFTPGIELTGGQTYQFSFYYITDGYAGWNQLSAWYGASPDSLSMTNLIASFSNVSGISYQKFAGAFVPPTTGVYFIGIKCVSASTAHFLTIDDLSLAAFDCYSPTNVAVSYISANAAQFNWDCNGCAGDFYVEYGLSPTYFGWVGNIGSSVSSSPYIMGNLQPDEDYTVYLQQACSNGGSPVVQVDFHTQVFTGIQGSGKEPDSFTIYPNPATSQFHLSATCAACQNESVEIEIIDMLGRVYQTPEAKFNCGQLEVTITSEGVLTSGQYIVRIKSADCYMTLPLKLQRQ